MRNVSGGGAEWNPSLSTGGGGGKKEKGQEKVYGVRGEKGSGQERDAPEVVPGPGPSKRRADVPWGTAGLSLTGRVFPPLPGCAFHPATHLDS